MQNDCLQTRLRFSREAVESAGAALLVLRGVGVKGQEGPGGQLKTAIDRAAEGWVYGYLNALFPEDSFLCEEMFEKNGSEWHAPPAYWTIDALDGTRSYVEGFDGFCVQVGYVEDGQVQVGVVHEPARRATYWSIRGKGAFLEEHGHRQQLLSLWPTPTWPTRPRFVDSTRPTGVVGEILAMFSGDFVECGSIGLKACRVADGSADVFAKKLNFKLWDVVPAALIVSESGGKVGTWDGQEIPFDSNQTSFENLLVARRGLFGQVAKELAQRYRLRGDAC